MANKKSFGDVENPALNFITKLPKTQPQEIQQEISKSPNPDTAETISKRMSHTKEKEQEIRSKRTSFATTPSLYENFLKIAQYERKTPNDLINSILQDYVDKNRDKIDMIDEINKKLYG